MLKKSVNLFSVFLESVQTDLFSFPLSREFCSTIRSGKRLCLRLCLIFLVTFCFTVQAGAVEIPLKKYAGVYTLPVRINGAVTLNFILDTGASEVTIPSNVALTLLRAGTIREGDFLPGRKYRLADGSILKGSRFKIRELEVGGLKISNVPAAVAPGRGPLLLGQSFLSRVGNWSINNEKQLLLISDSKKAESPSRSDELKPEISDIDTWRSTLQGDGQASSREKIPPSREVDRTTDGKIPPSR
jgi:clan AA aspartic protease (TIGR02281 family)